MNTLLPALDLLNVRASSIFRAFADPSFSSVDLEMKAKSPPEYRHSFIESEENDLRYWLMFRNRTCKSLAQTHSQIA